MQWRVILARNIFWLRFIMIIRNWERVKRIPHLSIFFSSSMDDALLDLRDSSGIRFYLGNDLRPHDLGYLVLGTSSNPASLALPPDVLQFRVDSFCPPEATRVWISILRSDALTSFLLFIFVGYSTIGYQYYIRLTPYAFARHCSRAYLEKNLPMVSILFRSECLDQADSE